MRDALVLAPFSERYVELTWHWLHDPELLTSIMGVPPESREAQRAWFDGLSGRTDYLIWGLEVGGLPIGACGLKHVEATSAEYWGWIADATYRGRGLGRAMMAAVHDEARRLGIRSLYLHVLDTNLPAIRLYQAFGYRRVSAQNHVVRMEHALT
jgi:RimJ/RimL family protein N-acetyltransferase